jgi:hypothetical protein
MAKYQNWSIRIHFGTFIQETTVRIFLAGIMQGSLIASEMHDQNYRLRLRNGLAEHFPEYEVYDPLEFNRDSISYGNKKGREVFLHHNQMCAEVDILLACVPEASMGTAIEMWEAWRHDKLVITISPLKNNWAVKFLSHILFDQETDFLTAMRDGSLRKQLIELGVPLGAAP